MTPHRRRLVPSRRSRGFSLVELMIAMVLGLVVLAAAIALLVGNQRSYRLNEDFGRLQEAARLVFDVMASDLRMAGFFGCARPDFQAAEYHLPAALGGGELADPTFAVEGYEAGQAQWLPSGSTEAVAAMVGGNDGVTLRKLAGPGAPLLASMAAADAPIDADPTIALLAAGQLAAVYDCDGADLFVASAVDAVGRTIGPNAPLSRAYQQNAAFLALADPAAADPRGRRAKAFVVRYDPVRYYVATSAIDGQPALFRAVFENDAVAEQELVGRVDALRVFFGVDQDSPPNGDADVFLRASGVTDWQRVVAVKVNVVLSTPEEYGTEIDDRPYDVMDTPGSDADDLVFNDRRERRMVSMTVLLRNMQPKL